VAVAAARIAVHLVDQLADGVHAVADHMRRIAPGGGDQLVADHQQAEIVARHVALDHHVVADLGGRPEGRAALLAVSMLTVTPLPWLPSCGLTTTGRRFLHGGGPGILGVDDRTALRHRHAGGLQQVLGELSLSWAMDSAMALVRSISAAWMRRCLLPQPNCTRLPSVRRR
jgi:hypothetical protein